MRSMKVWLLSHLGLLLAENRNSWGFKITPEITSLSHFYHKHYYTAAENTMHCITTQFLTFSSKVELLYKSATYHIKFRINQLRKMRN